MYSEKPPGFWCIRISIISYRCSKVNQGCLLLLLIPCKENHDIPCDQNYGFPMFPPFFWLISPSFGVQKKKVQSFSQSWNLIMAFQHVPAKIIQIPIYIYTYIYIYIYIYISHSIHILLHRVLKSRFRRPGLYWSARLRAVTSTTFWWRITRSATSAVGCGYYKVTHDLGLFKVIFYFPNGKSTMTGESIQ